MQCQLATDMKQVEGKGATTSVERKKEKKLFESGERLSVLALASLEKKEEIRLTRGERKKRLACLFLYKRTEKKGDKGFFFFRLAKRG